MAVSIPAAGFLVRLFMIQHGCGHGSLFRQRWLNNWVGRVVGDFTLTPYSHWRHSHNIHHASSGNLERRGIGDITTLTVSEYCQSTRWQRLGYRLYRNPAVMFGIGPGPTSSWFRTGCRACCAGSPPASASIMCITCAVAARITG